MLDALWYLLVFGAPIAAAVVVYKVLPEAKEQSVEGELFGKHKYKVTGAVATLVVLELLSILVYRDVRGYQVIKISLDHEGELQDSDMALLKAHLPDLALTMSLGGQQATLTDFRLEGRRVESKHTVSIARSYLGATINFLSSPSPPFSIQTTEHPVTSSISVRFTFSPRSTDNWRAASDTLVEVHDHVSNEALIERHSLLRNVSATNITRASMGQWNIDDISSLKVVIFRVPGGLFAEVASRLRIVTAGSVSTEQQLESLRRLEPGLEKISELEWPPKSTPPSQLKSLSVTDNQVSVSAFPLIRLDRIENTPPIGPSDGLYSIVYAKTSNDRHASLSYQYGAERAAIFVMAGPRSALCKHTAVQPMLDGSAGGPLEFARTPNSLMASVVHVRRDTRVKLRFVFGEPNC